MTTNKVELNKSVVLSIFAFCVALSVANGASAAVISNRDNYVAFSKSPQFEAYYDANYQSVDELGYRIVNVKITGFSARWRSWIHKNYPGAEMADFALLRYSVDCTGKRVAEHRVVFYDADGADLASHDAGEEMLPPTATTMEYWLMQKICGLETSPQPQVALQMGNPQNSASPGSTTGIRVQLESDAGTYFVPVLINGSTSLNFTVDSGASVVTVPSDVFSTLLKAGAIDKSDIIGQGNFTLANGSIVTSTIFIIRSLKVGNTTVSNVFGGVSSEHGPPLLGQSFLSRFKSWSIDNSSHELVLVEDTGHAGLSEQQAPVEVGH